MTNTHKNVWLISYRNKEFGFSKWKRLQISFEKLQSKKINFLLVLTARIYF